MSISINGNGSITGLSVGGLPDGSVDADSIAAGAVTNAKIGTGIDAAKLADGTVTSTELQYINSLSSNIQTQIGNVGGGKILQVATTQISMTHSGNSQNTWTDTNLTLAITPTASSSTILLRAMFIVYWVNTSGDSGVSIRFKQAISGGATTYPEGISSGTNANYHTLCYHTRAIAGHDYETYHLEGVASPATTSAVTYTMQYGTYNTESAGIGMGGAKARLTLMEIGA
jgi:hypothetical protein